MGPRSGLGKLETTWLRSPTGRGNRLKIDPVRVRIPPELFTSPHPKTAGYSPNPHRGRDFHSCESDYPPSHPCSMRVIPDGASSLKDHNTLTEGVSQVSYESICYPFWKWVAMSFAGLSSRHHCWSLKKITPLYTSHPTVRNDSVSRVSWLSQSQPTKEV